MAGSVGVLGTRLFVGATPLINIEDAADDILDFTALSVNAEVGEIESVGNFGKVFDLVSFQAVKDGRMYKYKGGYNGGSMAMVVAANLMDPGQAILEAAANRQDQDTLPFRIALNGADPTLDTIYFGGKVFSFEYQFGSVNNIVKANIRLEVNTEIFIGAA
jgi:hypothetical protein